MAKQFTLILFKWLNIFSALLKVPISRIMSVFNQSNLSVLDIIFEKIDTEPDALDIFKSWVNNEWGDKTILER